MKIIWSWRTKETPLESVLVVGNYYDIETFTSTQGCQVFKGVVDGEFTFFNQFAHDGFGAIDSYKKSEFFRIWENT